MKKLLLFGVLFLAFSISVFSQEEIKGRKKLPNSWLNVGAGLGMSYGGVGIKTILGNRNTGILLGVGKMPETIGYEIGLQLSVDWFYVNWGYGILETYQINNEPIETIKATNINIGAMMNLGESKRTFFDLGIGGTSEIESDIPSRDNEGRVDFSFSLGIGYRIGG